MNYLFHLYLSGDDPAILTGNFMGDFVKGPLAGRFPERLGRGLALHRRIDSFAQGHPAFTASRLRIAPEFGLYRGILVDLYYDHFLASAWRQWHEEPLPVYLRRVRKIVEGNRALLPERLQRLVPVIFEDMIPSYLSTDGIADALQRMSRRVPRINPLAGGGRELTRNYHALQEDFLQFLPDAARHSTQFLQD
ncbi:ACP phosphodiesterase [Geomonas paludis]|uniref:ACP phosphodiesterase n=1 Tax=Geomonas paludis TaxID=2740185 RepID=A0A6V8MZN3_9BACT|nr:ACP phosphodiesterase [Geomonas paludis]UPU34103.1 ACP phosphodiesterase [Geomonas paludis]GFO65622.1 ACP phosphodiesterase [Geomonas paludis]